MYFWVDCTNAFMVYCTALEQDWGVHYFGGRTQAGNCLFFPRTRIYESLYTRFFWAACLAGTACYHGYLPIHLDEAHCFTGILNAHLSGHI